MAGYEPFARNPAFLQQIFMVAEEFYLPDVSEKKIYSSQCPFFSGI